jgi:hypothetical protein
VLALQRRRWKRWSRVPSWATLQKSRIASKAGFGADRLRLVTAAFVDCAVPDKRHRLAGFQCPVPLGLDRREVDVRSEAASVIVGLGPRVATAQPRPIPSGSSSGGTCAPMLAEMEAAWSLIDFPQLLGREPAVVAEALRGDGRSLWHA